MSDDPLNLICPKIRASDFRYTKKAEDDESDLYCSRCYQLIEEGMISMSLYDSKEVYGEWRFHPKCVGMDNYFESSDRV